MFFILLFLLLQHGIFGFLALNSIKKPENFGIYNVTQLIKDSQLMDKVGKIVILDDSNVTTPNDFGILNIRESTENLSSDNETQSEYFRSKNENENTSSNINSQNETSDHSEILKSSTIMAKNCHKMCLRNLNDMRLKTYPKANYVLKGSTIEITCSLTVTREIETYRMIWLFQKSNPPSQMCSITPDNNIKQCEHISLEHEIDTSIINDTVDEKIVLRNLDKTQEGLYYCMVEMLCCSSHTMTRTLQTDRSINVYDTSDLLKIGFVLGFPIATVLFTVFLIFAYYANMFQRKSRVIKKRRNRVEKSEAEIPILKNEM